MHGLAQLVAQRLTYQPMAGLANRPVCTSHGHHIVPVEGAGRVIGMTRMPIPATVASSPTQASRVAWVIAIQLTSSAISIEALYLAATCGVVEDAQQVGPHADHLIVRKAHVKRGKAAADDVAALM
ncbi:MAG TPA: hypothetical protein VG405_06955 [Solirubrobacteraceae bacterium]|nr:hypothetical protein [Solirubrobacteraceae bacterium]